MSSQQLQQRGPWNPGIEQALPDALLPLSTIFDPANVSASLKELRGLSDLCGLSIERLSTFRPERLALHEVLIKVMADLTVPDGKKYEDLGVNFRAMTATIFDKHIAPVMPQIRQAFEQLNQDAAAFIDSAQMQPPGTAQKSLSLDSGRSRWWHPFGSGGKPAVRTAIASPEMDDLATIAGWRKQGEATQQPFEQACLRALVTIADAIFARRGRLLNDTSLMTALATRLVANDYGSLLIGQTIDPYFREAVLTEGYRLLPPKPHPVIMNVKGASASGKSTMRPLQKQLAGRLGVDWTDFALISPDIWRKHLLDYDTLGTARIYAGTLTGHEIEIIDKKLDRYMARKAQDGRMSHLLIDRFRFDSFSERPDESDGSRLLTRFGDEIYMFFMITPPEATVERAWKRGEQFGRYKAVEDLLAHNVEAYSGIPGLFFTWVHKADKKVHFEFLDNSVAEGEKPATVAFGVNDQMNILDLKCMFDIDRYKNINIEARSPQEVYPPQSRQRTGPPGEFLTQCVRQIPLINFANRKTGQIYARIQNGKFTWWDREAFTQAVTDPDARSAFEQLTQPPSGSGNDTRLKAGTEPAPLSQTQGPTVGQWP